MVKALKAPDHANFGPVIVYRHDDRDAVRRVDFCISKTIFLKMLQT